MSISNEATLAQYQSFFGEVYGKVDDRLYSLADLLVNQQRFTMRALKGIRKGDKNKVTTNLLIAFSWMMAVANRLHMDVESVVWYRFPRLCSYCGVSPCVCKKTKPTKRAKIKRNGVLKPKRLSDFQAMFAAIYPPARRTTADVGVHLAEEMGELSEAVHSFLGEHKERQFAAIQEELADYLSCLFGVANSLAIDIPKELARMYRNNCHVCHKAPCVCKFSLVSRYQS